MKRCLLRKLAIVLLGAFVLTFAIAFAEDNDSEPVVIDGKELFAIKVRVESFWPYDRAKIITKRILRIAEDTDISLDSIILESAENSIDIGAPNNIIMTVTTADAVAEQMTLEDLAKIRLIVVKKALADYRNEHSVKRLALHVLYTCLLTGLLYYLFKLLKQYTVKAQHFALQHELYLYYNRYLGRLPGASLISTGKLKRLLNGFIAATANFLRIVMLYLYLYIIFGLFPWTKQYSKQLLDYILIIVNATIATIVNFLPNGLIIIFIALCARYLLKFVYFLFEQVRQGRLKINGFYPEWVDPSYKIVRVLVLAIMAISMFPYIPGSQSMAFQGVSVFLGLLLSLGSSSVVSNIVAGISLTYTRAFSVGDRVRIADHEGDIIEKSLLVTRLRTNKNVYITLPNSLILNNANINYSYATQEAALVVTVSIPIAYDVPRQKAEELLIKAALATPDVLAQPAPFVVQMGFEDFAIAYDINAFTQKPNRKDGICSDLRKSIQDVFNEAGIEMMATYALSVKNEE